MKLPNISIQNTQQSCDSVEVSETENYTYFSEVGQSTDTLTCKDLRSSFSPLEPCKGYDMSGTSLRSLDLVSKNETREAKVKFSNHTHSHSLSLRLSDSEENNNALWESERHKRNCGTRCQEDNHFKTTRISNWIVQVSENMKKVA